MTVDETTSLNNVVRNEFDLLTIPKSPRVKMHPAHMAEIDEIYRLINKHIPTTVAPPSTMKTVMMLNRNSVFVFRRHGEIVGVYALLVLTALGLERLLVGEFSGLDPEFSVLATRLMTPAAIYQWMIVAPGVAAEGIRHVSVFLREPLYRHANLFGRPVTEGGLRFALSTGFSPIGKAQLGELYRYVRLVNRNALAQAA
jgi:hypothetical protein